MQHRGAVKRRKWQSRTPAIITAGYLHNSCCLQIAKWAASLFSCFSIRHFIASRSL